MTVTNGDIVLSLSFHFRRASPGGSERKGRFAGVLVAVNQDSTGTSPVVVLTGRGAEHILGLPTGQYIMVSPDTEDMS